MDDLDDLDKTIVEVLRQSGQAFDQYTLADNQYVKQKITMSMYDKWIMLLGRLRRLEAKDYIKLNIETNQYSYK